MPSSTPGANLVAAVQAVAWKDNVDEFGKQAQPKEQIANSVYLPALWSKQLETADAGNPSLAFVREMQLLAQYGATLIALGLYKPAASSMRAMYESAMYYTYFRSHPVELETLVRDERYFIDKKTILQFHKQHTVLFDERQTALGLVSKVDKWYSTTSAVVHGQIPGKWVSSTRIEDIAFNEAFSAEAATVFAEACELIHALFLCTIDLPRWYKFSKPAKGELLKGLTPQKKKILALPVS